MTFLPIVQRELLVRAQRASTHWSRWVVAFVASLVCVEVFAYHSSVGDQSSGPALYTMLGAMVFLLACGSALLTADAVCVERREGTLGLLFLTSLRGYDVVLGKMAAAGLGACYALLGFAPAMALSLLAGGVTGGELFRTTLGTLNTLWLGLALGMWVSVRAQSQFQALRNASCLMFLLVFLPALVATIWQHIFNETALFGTISPLYTLMRAGADNFDREPAPYWISLATVHAEGWLLLIASSFKVSRSWRDSERSSGIATFKSYQGRRKLARMRPVCWRALRLPGQRTIFWGTSLVGAVTGWLYLAMMMLDSGDDNWVWRYLGAHTIIGFGLATVIAWAATRFIMDARRTGELELLMVTPAGAEDIVTGQWRALWVGMRWPMACALLITLLPTAVEAFQMHYGAPFVAILQIGIELVGSVVSFFALGWVGMWFGAHSKKMLTAVVSTVGLVAGIPWLLSVAGYSVSGLIDLSSNFYVAGLLMLALSVVTILLHLFLIRWARRKLHAAFGDNSAVGWSQFVNRSNAEMEIARAAQVVPTYL